MSLLAEQTMRSSCPPFWKVLICSGELGQVFLAGKQVGGSFHVMQS